MRRGKKMNKSKLKLYVDGKLVYEKQGDVQGEIAVTINDKPFFKGWFLPKDW